MAETHFIEVVAGRGEPPSLELRPGVELAPLSVGSGGAWQVSAPGVLFVHLYVYFDGQMLFLQSADPNDPPTMNGHPVPSAWTSVPGRCTIAFGQAQLVFRPAEGEQHVEPEADDDSTVAAPVEAPPNYNPAPAARPVIPARPFKPGAFAAPVDESTRLQPLEDFLNTGEDPTRVEPLMGDTGDAGPPPVANIRPAAGSPWNQQPPPGQPMPDGRMSHGGPPPSVEVTEYPRPSGLMNIGPPSMRKPEAPETFGQRMGREWKTAPVFRKILIIAMPFGLGLAFWVIFAGAAPPSPPPKAVAGAPGASGSAGAAGASGTPTAGSAPTVAQTTPPPPPPQVDPGSRPGSTPAAGNAAAGDAGGGDRRERQAADFVATHAYDQAIRIYEQLAAERPQNPAFHEAARILREKLESGRP